MKIEKGSAMNTAIEIVPSQPGHEAGIIDRNRPCCLCNDKIDAGSAPISFSTRRQLEALP